MAVKTIRLPDGKVIKIDEWLHWPLYSTIEFAGPGSVNLRCFNYTRGQTVPNRGLTNRTANEADTNQNARARMNHDEQFIAFSVTYEHFSLEDGTITEASPDQTNAEEPMLAATNLRRLQRDIVVEFFVGAGIDKPMFRAPFSYIGQGVGAVAYSAGDGIASNVTISYGTAGNVRASNQRRWNLPIVIESDRTMHMRVNTPDGSISDLTQDTRLRFYLDGLKQRPMG